MEIERANFLQSFFNVNKIWDTGHYRGTTSSRSSPSIYWQTLKHRNLRYLTSSCFCKSGRSAAWSWPSESCLARVSRSFVTSVSCLSLVFNFLIESVKSFSSFSRLKSFTEFPYSNSSHLKSFKDWSTIVLHTPRTIIQHEGARRHLCKGP